MENIKEKLDIKNKIFYVVVFLLTFASIGLTFYRIVILNNYQIVAQVSCDPAIEKCFVYECDPEVDGVCSENPSENISFYKNISKKAATIATCEKTMLKVGCKDELSCIEGEKNCFYTLCDPSKLLEGEKCSE